VGLLHSVRDSISVEIVEASSRGEGLLKVVGDSVHVSIVQASLESSEASLAVSSLSLEAVGNSVSVEIVESSELLSSKTGLSIRSLSLEVVGDSVSVKVQSLRSREHSLGLETRLEASGLVHASLELIGDSISIEIGESSGVGSGGRSDSHVVHGQDSVVDSRGLDDLLIDGKSLLDEDGSVDLLVDDGLDFLDDLVNDGLMDDGGILDGSRHGGGDLSGRELGGHRSLGQESRVVLDDGGSGLSWESNLADFGGDDLSLSHGLNDLIDVELLSLSVDDGLDLNDFLGLVDFMDDGGLLNTLHHGGCLSDIDDRGKAGLNRSDESESLAFQLIGDSISVEVGELGLAVRSRSLQLVGDAISVQVGHGEASGLDHGRLSAESLRSDDLILEEISLDGESVDILGDRSSGGLGGGSGEDGSSRSQGGSGQWSSNQGSGGQSRVVLHSVGDSVAVLVRQSSMSSGSGGVLLHSIGDSVGIVVLVLVAGKMSSDSVLHGELLVVGRHCV